jgi:hypothetical protein
MVHVSLTDGRGGVFACRFRLMRSLANAFLPQRLVDQAVCGYLATNPAFRAWLRCLAQS